MLEDEQGGESSGPRTMSGGHKNQSHDSSASSKTEAIKESQEERERYVNESALNNE